MGSALPLLGGMASAASIDAETNTTMEALLAEQKAQTKNAEIAREAGAFNASRQQEDANQAYGTIRADVAASGTEQDSGNVFDILRQSHANAELDRLNILHGAELDAISSENRASGLARQIQSTRKVGEYRKIAALLGGAGGAVSQIPGESNAGSPRLRQTSDSGSRRSTGGGRYYSSEGY